MLVCLFYSFAAKKHRGGSQHTRHCCSLMKDPKATKEPLLPVSTPQATDDSPAAHPHDRMLVDVLRGLACADVLLSLILWALSIDSLADAFSGYDFTDGGSNLLGVVALAIGRAVATLLVTCRGIALAWQRRACAASAIVLIVKGAGFFSEWHTGTLNQVLLAGSMVMVVLEYYTASDLRSAGAETSAGKHESL